MNSKSLSRREFLKLSALAGVGLAAVPVLNACAPAATPAPTTAPTVPPTAPPMPTATPMPKTFDWQQFKGSQVNVLLTKNPWGDNIEKWIPEFEQLTGIKVQFENIPEIQARQKVTVDFAGGGTIDAFFTSLHVEKRRFSKAGWYEKLNPYLSDPTLTATDYEYEKDIFAASRSGVTGSDGSVYALPNFTDVWQFWYRTDIFEKKGLKPPKTLDEMMKFAKDLHNPPELYGFIARGLKNANAIGYTWVVRSLGGDVMKDGKANLTSKEAVDAMDYYAGILRQYAPPGVVNFNWQECVSAFAQGQVAQFFDGANFATQLEDATKSKVVGKVGYAMLPAGPSKQEVPTFTTGMAVSSASKNKKPAYLFCQWCTSKAIALRQQQAGVGTSRLSAWNDPSVKAKATMPQGWTDVFLESLKVGRLGLPEIVGVTEYRDIVGVAIQKAIQGESSKTALEVAQKEFQDMLDKTEK